MKRLLLLVLLLFMALPVSAQTATPTPTPTTNPYVHTQGLYEFYADPHITWSGSWSTTALGFSFRRLTTGTYLNNTFAAFTVSDNICTITVTGSSNATSGFNVIINGTINWNFVGVTASTDYPAVVDVSAVNGNMTVQIVQMSAGTLQIYYFQLLSCEDYPPTAFPSITPAKTATPQPTWTLAPSVTPQPTSTPANTPVNTATAVPTVPTATVVPTATPPNTPVPTATRIASSTPANTPVNTATAVPTVPTATILPSSTPANTPVNTATAVPTATPPNTPVDTATAIDIQSTIDYVLTIAAGGSAATATPTDTPTKTLTPTPTATFTPPPWVEITLTTGQVARFEYVATASDVQISNLLVLIFISTWGFFIFWFLKGRKK